MEVGFLASSATGSENSRDSFNSYANDGSEFGDMEGDPPKGKAAPPLTMTHWGLRVGRWIYNWVKIDSTATIKFMRTPTTDAKWNTYFHVGTTSMRDGELLAAGMYTLNFDGFSDSDHSSSWSVLALEVGEARSVAYRVIRNNCHEFVLDILRRMDARSDILWGGIRQKLFPGSRVALRTGLHTFYGTYVTLGVVGALTGGAAVPFLLAMFGAGMWAHGVETT